MIPGFGGASKDEDVLCLHWLMWGCNKPDCKRAHLFCDELPNGHGAKVGKYLEDGLG